MNMANVYQIKNKNTSDSYIGSSHGLPFGRWSEHLYLLKNHRHHSRRFQEVWNHSSLSDWDFRVLETDIEDSKRFAREQAWFELLTPTLNGTSNITKCIDRKNIEERVGEMLDAGHNYRHIKKTTGVSLGWITMFKRRRPM